MRDFKKYMGSKVHIVGDGSVLAKSLKDYLKRHPDIDKSLSRNGKRTYMTTDDPIKFKKMGEKFLGHPIPKIEMVNVEGGDGK